MRVFANIVAILVVFLSGSQSAFAENGPRLGLPIACILGEDCFLQQMPDMDPTSSAVDPFGTKATYDGHKGTDIRLRYMRDIKHDVPVIASATGKVLRLRDGVEDRLVRTAEDRAKVQDIECGNGLVIDHGDGWQTQYCHLKSGSVKVQEGQIVKMGDVIGSVGSSGMAQFPHIHLSVLKDGNPVDPFSATALLNVNVAKLKSNRDLWIDDNIFEAGANATQILDMGLSDSVVDQVSLLLDRPKEASRNSNAFVGWASLINLQEDDNVRVFLRGPSGDIIAQNQSKPLDRHKASYSLYAGKRGTPELGNYVVIAEIIRAGVSVLSRQEDFVIE